MLKLILADNQAIFRAGIAKVLAVEDEMRIVAQAQTQEQMFMALDKFRAAVLIVAGGFHSECMRPAADRLAAALREVRIVSPRVPFVSNVTAAVTSDPEAIRRQLAEQVCAPVLWERSMRLALARGIRDFLEPGPGAVLAGILSKIDAEARVRSVARPEDLDGTASPAG